jgi:hypothetical protein
MRAGQPGVDLRVGLKGNRDEDQKESKGRFLTKITRWLRVELVVELSV